MHTRPASRFFGIGFLAFSFTLLPGRTLEAAAADSTQPLRCVTLPRDGAAQVTYRVLAPHGQWLDHPQYGRVWQPRQSRTDADWRPYWHAGRWVLTEHGWFWHSLYPWGWLPFHYGRWERWGNHGWFWVPGTEWAPAWVHWRAAPQRLGWAVLPPGTDYDPRQGFGFGGTTVGFDGDFGLSAADYVIVDSTRLTDLNVGGIAPAPLAGNVFLDRSRVVPYLGGEPTPTVPQTFAPVEPPLPAHVGARPLEWHMHPLGGGGTASIPPVTAPAPPAAVTEPAPRRSTVYIDPTPPVVVAPYREWHVWADPYHDDWDWRWGGSISYRYGPWRRPPYWKPPFDRPHPWRHDPHDWHGKHWAPLPPWDKHHRPYVEPHQPPIVEPHPPHKPPHDPHIKHPGPHKRHPPGKHILPPKPEKHRPVPHKQKAPEHHIVPGQPGAHKDRAPHHIVPKRDPKAALKPRDKEGFFDKVRKHKHRP